MLGTNILEEVGSKYNGTLRVVRSFGLGTYIQSDGLTQSGGIVETFWKQTLKRIKNSKFKIKNCLVLGLGGGTVVKIIRKLWPEAKITGIDIDPLMVELGKKYLGLDETNLEIKIQDAAKPIPGKFYLVVVDLYQGDNFPKKFESSEFSRLVHGYVSKKGIVIFNRLYYKEKKKMAEEFGEKLKDVFKNVQYYYPEANIMFFCYN
jgi:spermidine synthase